MGNFTINVSTFISKPALGSANDLHIDISSVAITSTLPGTLTIQASDTNFIDPTVPTNVGFQTDVGGVTAGTTSFQVFIDDANFLFFFAEDPQSSQIAALGPFGPGPFAASTTGAADLGEVDPGFPFFSPFFSVSAQAIVTHTAGNQVTSFNLEVQQVPAPASLLLIGIGLLGLAVHARKRRKLTSV